MTGMYIQKYPKIFLAIFLQFFLYYFLYCPNRTTWITKKFSSLEGFDICSSWVSKTCICINFNIHFLLESYLFFEF